MKSHLVLRALGAAGFVLAALTAGCNSVGGAWSGAWGSAGIEGARRQYRQAVEEIKADMSIMDSDNDGLDAFSPSDAKLLRAARAEMNR
jgi:hypothetical protein